MNAVNIIHKYLSCIYYIVSNLNSQNSKFESFDIRNSMQLSHFQKDQWQIYLKIILIFLIIYCRTTLTIFPMKKSKIPSIHLRIAVDKCI